MKIGVGATKALSLLVVWCMVCSAFAGMLVLMVPGAGQALEPSEVDGDIYIGQDFTNSTWDVKGTVNLNGDLVIRAGGVVTVTDGLLKFRSWDGNINQLIIEDGGRLNLINSSLEAEYVLYDVSYALGVLVRNGGVLYAEDSTLDFYGKVLVDDAALIAHGTTISGPLFTAMSANVELYDSELIDTPSFPMLEELTYSYPFASAANQSIDVTYLFERNPGSSSTHDVALVQMNDSANVTLASTEVLTTSGFDIGGLVFNEGEAASITLKAEYKTADDFDDGGTPDSFYYTRYLETPTVAGNMDIVETYDPSNPSATNHEMVLSQDIGVAFSSIDLSMLSVSLTNNKAQDVFIDRIWLEIELAIPAYHNITVGGTSEFTAVDSVLGANYEAYDNYTYSKLVVTDAAQANLYGVTVQGTFDANGTGPYEVQEKELVFKPLEQGNDDTTIEPSVRDLLGDDGAQYVVPAGGVLHAQSFNTGGLAGDITSSRIEVEYTGAVGYTSSVYLQWNVSGSPLSGTTILIDSITTEVLTYDVPDGQLSNISQLTSVNIEFVNPDDDPVSFDRIWIIAELTPSFNLYRWVEATVVDSNNLPVNGATVNATESLSGTPASYFYNNSVSQTPPQGVLDYLGRDAISFKTTDEFGMVRMPLLTDIINPQWMPNSYAIENYRIEVDYVNVSAVHFIPSPEYPGFESYPSLGVQTVEMEFILEDLMLDLPDVEVINLQAVALTTEPNTIFQGDSAVLNFQVINNGLTTASRFSVSVIDSIGNVTNDLGIINVTNLLPGEVRNLSIAWISNYTTPGTHSIIATADTLDEVMEYDEGNVLTLQVTVLPFLPDLAVDSGSIVFSQNPGFAKQSMYINVTISNELGRLVAMGALVNFYIGNPLTGGSLQGTTVIEVAAGGTNVTSFLWTPIQIGTYPIYVTINQNHLISEYRYDNNMASNTLVVILVADTNDWLVNTVWSPIEQAVLGWQNNIIIEDDGVLQMYNSQLLMSQISTNLPTQIVVRDNGTLILDQCTVDSNYVLRIYLFDNASLQLTGSTLRSNIVLIMDDNSMVSMDDSIIYGDVQAPVSSSASLIAFNTTFGRPWSYFGGTSTAELTGASINGIPALSPKDGAVVTLYSWILASVYDGTGEHKIPDAFVEARSFIDQTVYATGFTNESGVWLFRALSDVVTSEGQGSLISGTYQLNATHWYGGDRYDSDVDQFAQVAYSPDIPLVRSDSLVRLDISSALPDVDPPFTVSSNEPLRGSEVTLSTVINNIGVVSAYDILIRFEDNNTAGKVLIEDYLIEELAAESNITVTVTWTATYPLGDHILSVTVDPLNEIPELNEDNNFNSTTVNVLGVPDLQVTASNIVVEPQFPIRDRDSSITVQVRNVGDNAISAFNVTFYDEGDLIGKREISNLPTGLIGTASITWTPAVPGLRNITVVLDEEGIIIESNETNNQAVVTVLVRDYSDLLASSIGFSVAGTVTSTAYVNSLVAINALLYNVGESSAEDFDVAFWLNGDELIDVVHVNNLDAGGQITVTTSWVAVIIPGEGLYQDNTITVVANPASNTTIIHIPEMDDPINANNEASQVLQVIDNRPDMAVSNGRIQSMGAAVTSATIGQKVQILFDLENVGIIDGTGIIVSVSLVNETIDMLLFTQEVNLGAGDVLPYNVTYVVNVTSGAYSFVIDIDAGSDANQTDNMMDIDFTIVVPSPNISINLGNKYDYAPGTSIFVQGTITQSGNNAPLAGQTVKVRIVDSQGFPLTGEYSATTNANGQFTAWVLVPSGKEGAQSLQVTVDTIEGEFTDDVEINIVAPFAPEAIPSWVYLLIVAIVIAVIVIFSLYLYRVGLGRMVECGNCGALIPEASRHCPKCGVEFESDTAKCSECGAWIPSKAESCPDCGAKFMTEPMEAGQAPGYIEAMRKQYDEYIEAFRGQAKAALGSKYSEEKFMEWLQTEPNYLPFEEWLRKEEMSRRSGVFPCPACGTLNPRDSKICNRCGTVFDQHGKSEAPKAEEKKSPFRRIVRRTGESNDAPKEQAPAEAPKSEESGDKPQ